MHKTDCQGRLPEVLCSLMPGLCRDDYALYVYDITDGTYHVHLVNRRTAEETEIRITDAVLLLMVANIPLLTSHAFFEKQALPLVEGDEIFLIDGAGSFLRCTITLAAPHHCAYRVEETQAQQPTWRGHIHLAIAPTKDMGRMEWMAEKATEVGWDEVSFLDTQFSERRSLRADRIDKIVVAAMKQSRKAWKPVVNEMASFRAFVDAHQEGRRRRRLRRHHRARGSRGRLLRRGGALRPGPGL